jgi:hypothetical protein
MATISCRDFQTQFERTNDTTRDVSAQAHIRECASCQSFIEDLGAIRSVAHSLEPADVEPPARIWVSLRAQLEEEGIIRNAAPKSWFGERFGGWFNSLPRPALAGAYLCALLAIAFGLSGPINARINRQRWLDGTETSTTPLSAHLMSAEQASFSSSVASESPVTASLHKNLEIVDNYIKLCENSVREEPENEDARDYLYGAYQQKADLLAQMSERRLNAEAPGQ